MSRTVKNIDEQPELYLVDENSHPSRKRKRSQLFPDNICTGTEFAEAMDNYVSPQTSMTFSHFNYPNQYGMIPPNCLSLENIGDSISFGPVTNEQISSVQQSMLPENNSLYGMATGFENYKPYHFPTNFQQALSFSLCTLYPPSPGTKITRNDKPPVCRTAYVGGLPGKISEAIIRDVFSHYGNIVTVRMNAKGFCHVRFSCEEDVERALTLSGYRMKIDNKDEAPYSGKLHVDYAKAKDDEHEAECAQRLALRRARHQVQKEQEALEMSKPRVNPVSEVELQNLICLFRDGNFKEGIHTLNTWLRRGEVEKRNTGTFFSAIQSLNSHIKKLLSEVKDHEQENKKAKLLHRQKLHEISLQLDDFEKLFNLAEKQNSWNYFDKKQRGDIEMHKKQTSEIKRANFEQLMDERIEDAMEVSDEENSVNEDFSKVQEAKLLNKQISEVENAIVSLEKNISSIRREKDDSLEALSQNLITRKKNLKELQEDHQKHLALHKRVKRVRTKENPVTKPKSWNSVEDFLKDACLLSLICEFLIVHPFAINIDYMCSYLDKIVSPASSAYVTNLMRRFPGVFKENVTGIGATRERKWSLIRLLTE